MPSQFLSHECTCVCDDIFLLPLATETFDIMPKTIHKKFVSMGVNHITATIDTNRVVSVIFILLIINL